MDNLDAVLKAHGSSLDHTVKFNLYVSLELKTRSSGHFPSPYTLLRLTLSATTSNFPFATHLNGAVLFANLWLCRLICTCTMWTNLTDSDHILQRLRRHQRRLHASYPHSPACPELYRRSKPPEGDRH